VKVYHDIMLLDSTAVCGLQSAADGKAPPVDVHWFLSPTQATPTSPLGSMILGRNRRPGWLCRIESDPLVVDSLPRIHAIHVKVCR
jgi:hypothetical protein